MQVLYPHDDELWLKVQQGDEPAYHALYNRYGKVLLSAIIKLVQNREDAEDLLQDVFLTIWEGGSKMKIKDNVFSYLYSVMRYKTLRYLSNKEISAKHTAAWQMIRESEGLIEWISQHEKDASVVLKEAVDSFPPQLKKVYTLYIDRQLSVTDIATEMQLSQHTVRNYLKEIRRRLKEDAGNLAWLLLLFLKD